MSKVNYLNRWTNATSLVQKEQAEQILELLSFTALYKVRLRRVGTFVYLTVLERADSGFMWVETHWQNVSGGVNVAKELAVNILEAKDDYYSSIGVAKAPEAKAPENHSTHSQIAPPHYGGSDNTYEVIKVLFTAGIGKEFCIGNAIKYISRMGKKEGSTFDTDCNKAIKYLQLLLANTAEKETVPLYQPRKFDVDSLKKEWVLLGDSDIALSFIFECKYNEAIKVLKTMLDA